MSLLVKEHVQKAKIAEQAQRYDEMTQAMTHVAKERTELTKEERNLLSVAFKNAVGNRRAGWRVLSSVEQKEESKEDPENPENVSLCREYREILQSELQSLCTRVLDLIDNNLLPSCSSPETRVFYLKMKGDYYRYIAEFSTGEANAEAAINANEAYREATHSASLGLTLTNPISLGLALNYSVFHYEVLNEPEKACAMAQRAFDNAINNLNGVSEDAYKDCTLIMRLLRDNLNLWRSGEKELVVHEETAEVVKICSEA